MTVLASDKAYRGQITVFLSLILVLMVSFLLTLFQASLIQVSRSRARTVSEMAEDSLFGEYCRALLDEYDIFAIDMSYCSGSGSESKLLDHYKEYLSYQTDMQKGTGISGNTVKWDGTLKEVQISALELLTDDGGRPCREQVSNYLKEKLGISIVEDLILSAKPAEKIKIAESEHTERRRENEKEMADLEQQKEQSGIEEDPEAEQQNPIDDVKSMQSSPFMELLLENPESVSAKSLRDGNLVSQRSLLKGYGEIDQGADRQGTVDNTLFREYIAETLNHYGDGDSSDTKQILYETEYIISGRASDFENLEDVSRKLMIMREAVNFGYLMTDTGKQAEAESMAVVLAGYFGIPPLVTAVKWALLLAWAYGESVLDMRTLLAGGKIPLVKTAASWELELGELASLPGEGFRMRRDRSTGSDYSAFLRLLLFSGNETDQTYRFMDLAEQQIQNMQGNPGFRMDTCVTGMTISNTWVFSRNAESSFPVSYRYQ